MSPVSEESAPSPTELSTVNNTSDTGPIPPSWQQDLLERCSDSLSALDNQEEILLHRLAALQKLQLLWSTAGRIGEQNRTEIRILKKTTKVLVEDKRLSGKRQKLSGVMEALQNVVGMLDATEGSGCDQAGL